MTKTKSTKRALLMSALALLMCVFMLIGSTFAWFTDTASTAVNAIQSGKLEVVLEKFDEAKGEWVSAEGEPLKWITTDEVDNVLWEPGCTYKLPKLRVRNAGNLALKYEVEITGLKGDAKLLEVIEFTGLPTNATLTAGAANEFQIEGHMAEEAGNEYQNLKIDSVAITVYATQLAYESDSYGPDYDEEAVIGTYIELGEGEDLLAALASAEAGKPVTINLMGNVEWPTEGHHGENDITPASAIVINGNGYTITATGAGVTPIGDTEAPMTLKNVKIVDKSVSYKEDAWELTYLEVGGTKLNCENVTFADEIQFGTNATFTNCTFESNEESVYAVWVEDGNATFKNCAFTGYRGIKVHEAYGSEVKTVVVDNCTFVNITKKPGVAIGTVNADTTVAIKDSKFVGCQAGDQNLYIYETDTDVTTFKFVDENNNVTKAVQVKDNTEFDNAIANGASTVVLGSGNYIIPDSAQGKTLTIVGNGNTVVANQNDGSYEGCDYSLDGSTVTFEGVTINTEGHTYAGYARCRATYNNCTINGSYTLYGESVFNNCTFNVTGDYYNIWTWGGKNIKFNDCTFNTDGKSILVYNQTCDVYVDGCTFNDRTNGANFTKSAFETGVDGVGAKYNIYINDTTVKGFAENDKCVGYKNIVGNKNSMSKEYLNIVIDGVDVY